MRKNLRCRERNFNMDDISDGKETEPATSRFPFPWKPLQRRIPLDDPFFEEGNILCNLSLKQISVSESELEELVTPYEEFPCQFSRCNRVFSSVAGYEMHYNAAHRNVCRECSRSFPTNHLLDVHLQEWHDAMFQLLAARQNMYQCLVESCSEKFATAKKRKDHLIQQHKYPANFRFDRAKPAARKKKNDHSKDQTSGSMEVDVPTESVSSRLTADDKTMDTLPSQPPHATRTFIYKVPKSIQFGQGAQRGFQHHRGRRRGKHWHQCGAQSHDTTDTAVNIEHVAMDDLVTALDES